MNSDETLSRGIFEHVLVLPNATFEPTAASGVGIIPRYAIKDDEVTT
jgi:hypothetical protein